ncbi:prenyltransferase [Leeia oryzae]|uniref:prenyltransferase n=1 Tax=Leeia oryzae TaxID=356662 RepID=UPI00036CFAEF|nr:prenyltransferase [Leeia oryzae]
MPTFATHLQSARPQFFTLSLSGLLLGLGLQVSSGHPLPLVDDLLAIITVLLVHAGANLINDVADEHNGTDRLNTDRISPFTGGSRFIQNGILQLTQVRRNALVCFGLAILCGLTLLARYPSLWLMGLTGIVLAWGYSSSPLRLNSRGLGELSLAIAFGLIPFGLASMLHTRLEDALPASLYFGLQATAVLFLNQYPDRKADKAAGKHHWVVRLGAGKASLIYLALIQFSFMALVASGLFGQHWLNMLAVIGLLPQMWSLIRTWQIKGEPAQMKEALIANLLGAHIGPVILAGVLLVH